MNASILYPVGAVVVRDPVTKNPLSPDGELKPLTGAEGRYWRRRLKDGSVVLDKPRQAALKKQPAAKTNVSMDEKEGKA